MTAAQADAASYQALTQHGTTLTVQLENCGQHPAEEVLQVYIRVLGSENEVPHPKLAAFRRVTLAPGAQMTVSVPVDAAAFSTVDDTGARVFDGTGAALYVGFGQPDDRTLALTGKPSVEITIGQ